MNPRKILIHLTQVLFCCAVLTLSGIAAQAATDMFLHIDGIEGESTAAGHEGSIEILSWSWGMSNSGSFSSGGGAGKVNVQDISFVKRYDKASPKLMEKVCTGTHIPKATLSVRVQQPDVAQTTIFEVTGVLVSSIRPGGTTGTDQLPLEEVSFNFEKIKVTYDKMEGGISTAHESAECINPDRVTPPVK